MTTAEQIVRALAAADPIGEGFGRGYCTLCNADIHVEGTVPPEDHKPDCPWRLAVEWLAAQPFDVGGPPERFTEDERDALLAAWAYMEGNARISTDPPDAAMDAAVAKLERLTARPEVQSEP